MSGQWTGYYKEGGKQVPFNLKSFQINSIPQGQLKAEGSQESAGGFTFAGNFDDNATTVRFQKKYNDFELVIYYQGELNGTQIKGKYGNKAGEQNVDQFKIWKK